MAIEIIKDYSYRQKFHVGFQRSSPPTQIIIHGTGGVEFKYYPVNKIASLGERFMWDVYYGAHKQDYIKGSSLFHYFIGEDGRCWEVIDPNNWVYHAAIGSADNTTIGIETFNILPNNQGQFAQNSIDTLYELIKYLLDTFPSITSIAGHGAREAEVDKKYKICPGPNFSWSSLQSWLSDRGYSYTLKSISYSFQRWGDDLKAISGIVSGEYIENIALTGEPSDSASDKKTEEEIVADNTEPEKVVPNPNVNADIFSNDLAIEPTGLKEIAVQGCILNHKSGSLISGGTFLITSTPSTKSKCISKGIFKTPIQYTFSGGSAAGCDPGTVTTLSPQTITASALKCKADGTLVMRKLDFGTMTAQGTLSGSPVAVSGLVEISDAGQDKVKAN